MNKTKLKKYLLEYKKSDFIIKPERKEWLENQIKFFDNFFKKSNLDKLSWDNLSEMADFIHSWNSMAIAKTQALNPKNNTIENIRDNLIHLKYGDGSDSERFTIVYKNIHKWGYSSISELMAHAFPEKYVYHNQIDKIAIEFFNGEPKYPKGATVGEKFILFNEDIKPFMEEYKKLVGNMINVPLSIELDQFFNYIVWIEGDTVELEHIIRENIESYILKRTSGDENIWNEEYKWNIVVKFGKGFYANLSSANILEKLKLLDSNKGNLVSFHGNISDLIKISNKNSEQLVVILKNLFKDNKDISVRIDNFINEAKGIDTNISLGTSLFGFLLASYDPYKYPFYKNDVYIWLRKQLKKNKKWKKFSIGKKYEIFQKKCVEIGEYIDSNDIIEEMNVRGVTIPNNIHALDGQDFLYVMSRGTSNVWIFQGNPDKFDVISYVKNNNIGNWSVNQHQDEINIGNKIYFWESGEHAGIIGVGEVLSDIYSSHGSEFGTKKVDVKFTAFLGDNPITRENFLKNEILSKSSIIKQSHATNFAVTDEEAKEIEKLLQNLNISKSKSPNDIFPLNQILTGPPGTGKTYNTINKALQIIHNDKNYCENKERKELVNEFNEFKELGQIKFITFHQSYGYEEFVEGIRPMIDNDSDIIQYEIKEGIFKTIASAARLGFIQSGIGFKKDNKPKNYVLIIDEINRGNISRIFGELITLIEEDKRAGAKNELSTTLPYSQENFTVPKNLYIIGTMNTADRSIALIDIALRRRFDFVHFGPKEEKVPEKYRNLFIKINEKILIENGVDFQIGHSYFMDIEDETALERTFNRKVIPLLNEYFYNEVDTIADILNYAGIEIDDKAKRQKRILFKSYSSKHDQD